MSDKPTLHQAALQLEAACAKLSLANLHRLNARAATHMARLEVGNREELELEAETALESAIVEVLLAAGVAKQARVEAEAPRLAVVAREGA